MDNRWYDPRDRMPYPDTVVWVLDSERLDATEGEWWPDRLYWAVAPVLGHPYLLTTSQVEAWSPILVDEDAPEPPLDGEGWA